MSNEKEDLKNQLQSIKDNLDKKLSEAVVSNQKKSPKNINSTKSSTSKKKKPIPIKVDMEVVSVVETKNKNKEEKKPQKTTKTKSTVVASNVVSNKKKTAPQKIKKEKKKKKLPVLPIVLLLILLGSLAYVYSLKKGLKEEENKFEKDKAEAIDYSNDVYFKEVEDEVDDEEMQDFAVYKDVPEVVAENNSESKVLSASDEKNIDSQIAQEQTVLQKTTSSKNANQEIVEQSTANTAEVAKENPSSVIKTTNPLVTTTDESKKENSSEIKKDMVYADMIRVVGLEHKDGNFTLPKKAKRTNAFKIRIRLKKNQINTSDEDDEIMLVIKDSDGKTIKIDSKKVNFSKQKSKVLNLEFYEIFPERLKTNTNYSFSVFVDRRLIKSYRKSI